jgi:hypothetical protein
MYCSWCVFVWKGMYQGPAAFTCRMQRSLMYHVLALHATRPFLCVRACARARACVCVCGRVWLCVCSPSFPPLSFFPPPLSHSSGHTTGDWGVAVERVAAQGGGLTDHMGAMAGQHGPGSVVWFQGGHREASGGDRAQRPGYPPHHEPRPRGAGGNTRGQRGAFLRGCQNCRPAVVRRRPGIFPQRPAPRNQPLERAPAVPHGTLTGGGPASSGSALIPGTNLRSGLLRSRTGPCLGPWSRAAGDGRAMSG